GLGWGSGRGGNVAGDAVPAHRVAQGGVDDGVDVADRPVAQARSLLQWSRPLGPTVRRGHGIAGDPRLGGGRLTDRVGDLLPGVAVGLELGDEVEHGLVVLAGRRAGWSSSGVEELAVHGVEVHRRQLLESDAADGGRDVEPYVAGVADVG